MNWDEYFLKICNVVGSKSRCKSIQRGAILVRDNSIVATGYNGPARGVPHCGNDRYTTDEFLREEMKEKWSPSFIQRMEHECPRRILGYCSGEGLHLCPAAHAEQNCIANAARLGVITKGCTLYMNCEVPCSTCLSILTNAGVEEIVVTELKFYDPLSKFVAGDRVSIRIFGRPFARKRTNRP